MTGPEFVTALQASPLVIGHSAIFAGFVLFVLRVNHRMDELDAAELDALTPDADSEGAFAADVTTWRLRRLQGERR